MTSEQRCAVGGCGHDRTKHSNEVGCKVCWRTRGNRWSGIADPHHDFVRMYEASEPTSEQPISVLWDEYDACVGALSDTNNPLASQAREARAAIEAAIRESLQQRITAVRGDILTVAIEEV